MNGALQCHIHWNTLPLDEWEARFATIKRSNILQSYDYAIASARYGKHKARWGVIEINGKKAGLVQVLEASILFKAFHAVMIDRGPLWFDGFGGAAHIQAFWQTMQAEFPKRFGRRRRFMPETEEGATATAILQQTGIVPKQNLEPHQSLWWDLNLSEDEARNALKPNWRGSLQKAEKAELEIEWDENLTSYKAFKTYYIADKTMRGYHGLSPQLLDNLALISAKRPFMIIGNATHKGEIVASVLILTHGQSATYQIGWALDAGRKKCAHHLLLWQARTFLKAHGINDFDLGGINDEQSAAGIKKFKMGTGAVPYKLVGQYE